MTIEMSGIWYKFAWPELTPIVDNAKPGDSDLVTFSEDKPFVPKHVFQIFNVWHLFSPTRNQELSQAVVRLVC